jgi:ketosteroid isomerase-like protein
MNIRVSEQIWDEFKSILKVPRTIKVRPEERIRELEAKEDIRELLTTYTYFWNSKDVNGILSIMTEDCKIIHGKPYEGVYQGKEEVRRFFENILIEAPKKGLRLEEQEDKHHITNLMIRVDEEMRDAKAASYFLRVSSGKKNGREVGVIATGWYTFELRKENGEWRIRSMKIFRRMQSKEFDVIPFL